MEVLRRCVAVTWDAFIWIYWPQYHLFPERRKKIDLAGEQLPATQIEFWVSGFPACVM